MEREKGAELESVVNDLVGTRRRMSIGNLLNTDDTDIFETLEHDEMLSNIVQSRRGSCDEGNGNVKRDGDGPTPRRISDTKATIQTIRIVMESNELQSEIDLELQRRLSSLLRCCRAQHAQGLRQSTIGSFFLL